VKKTSSLLVLLLFLLFFTAAPAFAGQAENAPGTVTVVGKVVKSDVPGKMPTYELLVSGPGPLPHICYVAKIPRVRSYILSGPQKFQAYVGKTVIVKGYPLRYYVNQKPVFRVKTIDLYQSGPVPYRR